MSNKNSNRDILDTLYDALCDSGKKLSPTDQTRLDRLRDVYAHWLDHPIISDTAIRDYIMANYSVGRAQAYNDIAVIKAVFGNVPKADKELQRYKANRLLDMASAAALAGNDRKAKALTKIADSLVRVNQLDEPEGEDFPWDEIVPKDYSFTVDPRVIGIEPEPGIEAKSRRLLKQYTQELDQDIMEVPDERDQSEIS